jgi:hypothetical protein
MLAKSGENQGKYLNIWGKHNFCSWILGFLMDFDGFHTIYNPCHGTVV